MANVHLKRFLIIAGVPLTVALLDKFIIKSSFGIPSLFLLSLALMLIWDIVFNIKKQLLINFLNVTAFTLLYLLITKLAVKGDQHIWQKALSGLVIGLIVNLINNAILPKQPIEK